MDTKYYQPRDNTSRGILSFIQDTMDTRSQHSFICRRVVQRNYSCRRQLVVLQQQTKMSSTFQTLRSTQHTKVEDKLLKYPKRSLSGPDVYTKYNAATQQVAATKKVRPYQSKQIAAAKQSKQNKEIAAAKHGTPQVAKHDVAAVLQTGSFAQTTGGCPAHISLCDLQTKYE